MSYVVLGKIIEAEEYNMNVWGAFMGVKFIWVMQTLLGLGWDLDLNCPPEESGGTPWLWEFSCGA